MDYFLACSSMRKRIALSRRSQPRSVWDRHTRESGYPGVSADAHGHAAAPRLIIRDSGTLNARFPRNGLRIRPPERTQSVHLLLAPVNVGTVREVPCPLLTDHTNWPTSSPSISS